MPTASERSLLLLMLLPGCAKDYEIIPKAPEVDPGDVTPCDFTEIPGSPVLEYDCNPVFDGAGEEWGDQVDSVGFHTVEVLGHPFYQIWYTARPEGEEDAGWWGLGYAISAEGTDWEVNPDNPVLESASDGWNADGMGAMDVVWDTNEDQYVLTYQGYSYGGSGLATLGFGVATSDDGVRWTQHPDNPVIDFLVSDGYPSICWPLTVTANDRGGYTGYMAATGSAEDDSCQIYPAHSDDLSSWTLLDRPVLEELDDYDASGAVSADIVRLGDTYYLFYVGFEEWEDHIGYRTSKTHSVNLATSKNGISWTKYEGNPLPVSRNDEGLVGAVAAQVVGDRIHLWVTDYYPALDRSAVGYYLFEPED